MFAIEPMRHICLKKFDRVMTTRFSFCTLRGLFSSGTPIGGGARVPLLNCNCPNVKDV